MVSVINVNGMTCEHCRILVERAALSIAGVVNAVVDLKASKLFVTLTREDKETFSALTDAITKAGFEVV